MANVQLRQTGSDKRGLANTAFDSLALANKATQNSIQYEQQSVEGRQQLAQNTQQVIGNTSSVIAQAETKALGAEAQRVQRKADMTIANTSVGGGAVGAIADALVNFGKTKLEVDQRDRELNVAETQLRNRELAQVAERQAEAQRQAQAEAKAKFEEDKKMQYAAATDELLSFQTEFKARDGFKKEGPSIYRNRARDIIAKYPYLDGDQIRALSETANKDYREDVDNVVERNVKYQEDVTAQKRDAIISAGMMRLSGPLTKLRNSEYKDPNQFLTEINDIAGEFTNNSDLDELTKMSALSLFYGKALENLDVRNNSHAEVQKKLTAIDAYVPILNEYTRLLEAGEMSPQMYSNKLQQERTRLGVPGEFKDYKPFATEEMLRDNLSRQDQISKYNEARIIDAAKSQNLTNQSLGYFAYQLISDPSLVTQLEGSDVAIAKPFVRRGIEIQKRYMENVKENQALALKRDAINEDLAQMRVQGVKWLISNSPNARGDDSNDLIKQMLTGLPTSGGGSASGITAAERAEYESAMQQVEVVLRERARSYDKQIADNNKELEPYGLNASPQQLKELMAKRKKGFDTEMGALDQQLMNAASTTTTKPQLGVSTPFNGGVSKGSYITPRENVKTLYSFNIGVKLPGNSKAVLPFKAGAPISGVTGASARNFLEVRPGGKRHAGEDIGAPAGTPIVSYIGGTVFNVGTDFGESGRGYGYYIDILGNDGMIHRFAHTQKGSIRIKKGERIDAGDVVAKVGDSGSPGSLHLHWEIRKKISDNPMDGGHFGSRNVVAPMDYVVRNGAVASVAPKPRGNKSGWSVEPGVTVPRIPANALNLGGGMYILNGKVGKISMPKANEKPVEQVHNSGNPVRSGYENGRIVNGFAVQGKVKNNPTANYGYAAVANDKPFLKAVADVADKLEIPAQWLMDCIAYESAGSFSPGQRNLAGSGATGLIQFMPSWKNYSKLSSMTRAQQMNEVYEFLKPHKKYLKKGIEYLVVSYWGNGYEWLPKMAANPERMRNWGEPGVKTLPQYLNGLGKFTGRKYEHYYNKRERLTATTHETYVADCSMCAALQASNSPVVPHEGTA